MSNNKISQIKLPNNNEIYDIEGRNVQRISWSDYSNLSEEDKKSNTAYYITNIPLDEGSYKHVEGSVISIDDGKLNEPLKECTVDINPVQDLHGYDHPWAGGTGKNKFPSGTISFTKSEYYTCELEAGTYTLSALVTSTDTEGTRCLFVVRDSNKQTLAIGRINRDTRSSVTFTITEQANNIVFYAGYNGNQSTGDDATWANVQIEVGSTATTFAPYSNICPISGRTEANITVAGKNLFNKNGSFVNAYCDYLKKLIANNNRRSVILPVKSGESYKIITGGTSQGMSRYAFTKTYPEINADFPNGVREYVDGQVITVPADYNYIVITLYAYDSAVDTFETVVNAFAVNYPSTDTSYHAYNGTTYTISLNGTRYGGTLDVVSGSYLDCDSTIQLSSIDAFSSDEVNNNGYIRYNCIVSDKAQNFNIVCDKIKVIDTTVRADASSEMISGSLTNNRLYFTIDSTRLTGDLSTASGRKQALKTLLQTDDIQVVYELATPTEVSLIPTEITTLHGNNVFWADCGDIAITYTYESNNQIRMGDEIFSVGSNAQTISGHTVLTDVPADAVFTDTTYSVTPVTISTAQKGSDITVDDITAWNAGSVTTVTYNETTHSIIINNGVLPSLSYTAKNVPNITTEDIQVVKDVSVVNSNITDG